MIKSNKPAKCQSRQNMSSKDNINCKDANENENTLFPIFLDEQTGCVPGNSSPSAGEKAGPNRESKLAEITLKLEDRDVPVLEVKRLIAKEIVLTMQYMRTLGREGAAAAER